MKSLLIILFLPSLAFSDCDVQSVVQQIRPGAQWVMTNNDVSTLVWMSTQTIPSKVEVQQAISDCQTQQIITRQQMQNDIFNVKLSTNTAQFRLQSLIDLMQLRGQL